IIATYARQGRERGAEVTIVSSDKDLMQLVGDQVQLFDAMKSREIGPAEVMEKFGVPPEKVIDVQALAGDSTDNVPGVPGIGVKTAAELINTYGDLETLLARATEIRQPKRRESLINFAEQARISYQLVRLKDAVPLDLGLDDLKLGPVEWPKLAAFLDEMEFRTLKVRIENRLKLRGNGSVATSAMAAQTAPAIPLAFEGE